jgi:hypothetical protein
MAINSMGLSNGGLKNHREMGGCFYRELLHQNQVHPDGDGWQSRQRGTTGGHSDRPKPLAPMRQSGAT